MTAVDSFALLLIERLGVRNLEAVFAVLITTMAVSFGVMYVLAGVPTAEVVEGAWQIQGLPRVCQGLAGVCVLVAAEAARARGLQHSGLDMSAGGRARGGGRQVLTSRFTGCKP